MAVTIWFACSSQAVRPLPVVTGIGRWRILAAFQLFTCQRKPLQPKLERVANCNETPATVKGVDRSGGEKSRDFRHFPTRRHRPPALPEAGIIRRGNKCRRTFGRTVTPGHSRRPP